MTSDAGCAAPADPTVLEAAAHFMQLATASHGWVVAGRPSLQTGGPAPPGKEKRNSSQASFKGRPHLLRVLYGQAGGKTLLATVTHPKSPHL